MGIGGGAVRGKAGLLSVACLLLLPAGTARAADAVATFDDLVAGTAVSSQYHNLGGPDRGLDFNQAPQPYSSGGAPHVLDVGAGTAQSGSHVAERSFQNCTPEFCAGSIWGHFTYAKQHVSLYVGLHQSSMFSDAPTLKLFDASGDQVGYTGSATVFGGAGYHTQLSVNLPSQQAVYFQVTGGSHSEIAIDDVSFDNPATPPPADFKLKARPLISPGLVGNTVVQGKTLSIPIDVSRFNRSQGNIHMSVDAASLPRGVSASVSPADTDDPAGATVIVNLRAAADAPESRDVQVRITGTPADAQAGVGAKTINVPVSVAAVNVYDMRITGMEVTQGIQTRGPGDSQGGALGSAELPKRDPAHPEAAVDYSKTGTLLVEGRKTVVRVYANNARPVPFGGLGGATVALYGYDSAGRPLPDSPIFPDAGPTPLPSSGLPFVSLADRLNARSAYTFTLPAQFSPNYGESGEYKRAWAGGRITLRAVAIPPDTEVLHECRGCQTNNSFALSDIRFFLTGGFTILPVKMESPTARQTGNPARILGQPWDIFRQIATVIPMNIYAGSYVASLDVAGKANDPNQKNAQSDSLDLLEDFDDDYGPVSGDYAVGVTNYNVGSTEHGAKLFDSRPRSIVDARTTNSYTDKSGNPAPPPPGAQLSRPLTSIAHEITHGLGRVHASACGGGDSNGQTGELWAPDQKGYIQGVGLDVSGQGSPAPGFYKTFNPTDYDYMSYCANIGSGDPNDWVSDRGWNQVINSYAMRPFPVLPSERPFASAASARPRAATGKRLRVAAMIRPDGTRIAFIKPSNGSPLRPSPGTPYRLVGLGPGARKAAVSGMTVTTGHADLPNAFPFVFVRGDLPAAGLQGVEIMRGGTVLRKIMRSPHAPKLEILAPTRHTKTSCHGTVSVRWRGTDADGGLLRAKVDYSGDGGRSFTPIFIGGNTGHARLPGSYFTPSGKARIRIRLNDGFNETARLSKRFHAAGCPPTVTILSPRQPLKIRADATLYLSGQAFQDGLRRLTGKRLRWYAGRRFIGNGEALSATGLPPGRTRLRLVAKDHRGRLGSAATIVRVTRVAPLFVKLRGPSKLSKRTHRLKLVVESSIPATLQVGRAKFNVRRRTRTLKIRIKPGGKPLVLHLRLKAYGKTTKHTLRIPRR